MINQIDKLTEGSSLDLFESTEAIFSYEFTCGTWLCLKLSSGSRMNRRIGWTGDKWTQKCKSGQWACEKRSSHIKNLLPLIFLPTSSDGTGKNELRLHNGRAIPTGYFKSHLLASRLWVHWGRAGYSGCSRHAIWFLTWLFDSYLLVDDGVFQWNFCQHRAVIRGLIFLLVKQEYQS